MKMKPLSAGCSEGVFCQNGLAVDYPLGSRAGTMLECIALTGTHYASVHMFAHASGQLAAGLRPMLRHRHHLVFGGFLGCQGVYQEKSTVKGLARLAPRQIATWHLRRRRTAAYGNGHSLLGWFVDQVIAPCPHRTMGYVIWGWIAPQRQHWPAASVGQERAVAGIGPVGLWTAHGRADAPGGHFRIPVDVEPVRRKDSPH